MFFGHRKWGELQEPEPGLLCLWLCEAKQPLQPRSWVGSSTSQLGRQLEYSPPHWSACFLLLSCTLRFWKAFGTKGFGSHMWVCGGRMDHLGFSENCRFSLISLCSELSLSSLAHPV